MAGKTEKNLRFVFFEKEMSDFNPRLFQDFNAENIVVIANEAGAPGEVRIDTSTIRVRSIQQQSMGILYIPLNDGLCA